MRFYIEDIFHGELLSGNYRTIADAQAELKRRASIPWDEEPNRPPCTSWETCGRTYHIVEYDNSKRPWKELQRIPSLEISELGVTWLMLEQTAT